MRLTWVTDPHLNFVDETGWEVFAAEVVQTEPDAVLVGGDIDEAPGLATWLRRMRRAWGAPVYFVLGNHDYYRGSIRDVRSRVAALPDEGLVWLSGSDPVRLDERTALVGHDGWGDARLGDFHRSPILLNDFFRITELAGLERAELKARLRLLGDEAGDHLRRVLPTALSALPRGGTVYVLTHVPPFLESSWHQGHFSDDHWAPFFTCKAAGDAILAAADAYSDRRLVVLCGHTHSGGVQESLRPNLVVHTGAAEYGRPRVGRVFETG